MTAIRSRSRHLRPPPTRRAPNHMVAAADHLASSAGSAMFERGGNAVDAAIATGAVMAVTSPHLCGLGGDLFALVHAGDEVSALNASGRAGSGADPAPLRAEGRSEMPFRNDIRTVTVPGCVDGWLALHRRYGTLALGVVLGPAQRLADDGFPASPLLVAALARLDRAGRNSLVELAGQAVRTGSRVRLPGVATVLRELSAGDRTSFYGGAFGDGLCELGGGLFSDEDLSTDQATWCEPLSASAFGVDLHTIPPNSQGYLTVAGARLAERLPLPEDPDDPRWAHLLIEVAKTAGHDRLEVLHEDADGAALIAAIDKRLDEVRFDGASALRAPDRDGDTTYVCTAGVGGDGRMMGVSLIQSNASGFGTHLVEPNTGINLHNRGIGFDLRPGHPAELGPGRRPPHTLSPALVTRGESLVAVLGTMGGDAQPQILLQLVTRLFHHRQSPAAAIGAGRWALRGRPTAFDTWRATSGPAVDIEGHASPLWSDGLVELGHRLVPAAPGDASFGHAHAIVVGEDRVLTGAADPRALVGSVTGG